MIASAPSVRILFVVAVLGLASGCMTDDSGRPTNQATGTVVGATVGSVVGGLAFGWGGALGGAVVGGLAGNMVGRALDEQERRRLAEATQRAYASDSNEPIVYTVEPTTTPSSATPAAPPTVVSAKPVGPKASRADGSTCRPLELTATKNGQTTRETTTFCQSPGSTELKPVSV
jgi:surface antigen